MATQAQDNDDKVRQLSREALDALLNQYWAAKNATPPKPFDEVFDLRRAYENAVAEYAALEGRLLHDEILSSNADVTKFQKVRDQMQNAADTKEALKLAESLTKMMVALA